MLALQVYALLHLFHGVYVPPSITQSFSILILHLWSLSRSFPTSHPFVANIGWFTRASSSRIIFCQPMSTLNSTAYHIATAFRDDGSRTWSLVSQNVASTLPAWLRATVPIPILPTDTSIDPSQFNFIKASEGFFHCLAGLIEGGWLLSCPRLFCACSYSCTYLYPSLLGWLPKVVSSPLHKLMITLKPNLPCHCSKKLPFLPPQTYPANYQTVEKIPFHSSRSSEFFYHIPAKHLKLKDNSKEYGLGFPPFVRIEYTKDQAWFDDEID